MPSLQAQRFSEIFKSVFKRSAVLSGGQVRQLRSAKVAIDDPRERAAAMELLALVKDDKKLDRIEVVPARRALSRLLGVDRDQLPAALRDILHHAVPAPNVRITDYALDLDLRKPGPIFPVGATITLAKKAGPLTILEVDPTRLRIREVRALGRPVPFEVKQDRLYVNAEGAAKIDVRYDLRCTDDPNSYGLIRDPKTGAMWTLTWPYDTGALFPSNSSPIDGATATIRVRVNHGTEVVGADGVNATLRTDRPVPPYAISLYAGRFTDQRTTRAKCGVKVVSHGHGTSIRSEVRAAYRKATADTIDYMSEKIGAFPFGDRLDLIEVKGDYGGMEHAARIALMIGSIRSRADAEETAVHETIHHWFGNGTRIGGWGQFWMSEGFTNYWTYRFFGQRDGQKAFYALFDRAKGMVHDALKKKRQTIEAPEWVDIHQTFTDIPYQLGPWLLRMIEDRLGTPAFDRMMKHWFRAELGSAVTTEQFIDFVKAETGHDLQTFFRAWGRITTVPRFKDRSKIDGQEVSVDLRADTLFPAGIAIPLLIEGKNGEKKTVRVDPRAPIRVDAGFAVKRIVWDPERWVLAEIAP